MEISALASGSSGNCFYIGNGKAAILIDAGISAKQILLRLEKINIDPQKIRALFITHEHIDHVRGSDVIARKLNIPIYATKETAKNCFLCSDRKLINHIDQNSITDIYGLKVEAFSKSHHAADPVSFNVIEKKKVSVITDAGHACVNIKNHVSDCDFLCLEANHDENMLENGHYPRFLKNLIKSDLGHLSNLQAALCTLEFASPKLKTIILSHLSRTNNTPQLALKTFNSIIRERKNFNPFIEISQREEPTTLFKI